MGTVWLGIDPGVSGALAVIDRDKILFRDTPVLTIKTGKSTKRMMDVAEAASVIRGFRTIALGRGAEIHAVVEKVNAMPDIKDKRSMGATSAFSFGTNFGMWIGMLAALKISYDLVHPATWKKELLEGMSKGKDASVLRCKQLFPKIADQLNRKKDHNRADALLLAQYGKLKWRQR